MFPVWIVHTWSMCFFCSRKSLCVVRYFTFDFIDVFALPFAFPMICNVTGFSLQDTGKPLEAVGISNILKQKT